MAVYKFSILSELVENNHDFGNFSGMVGSSAERYVDALLPTLS